MIKPRSGGVVKYFNGSELTEFVYTSGHNGSGGMDWDGDYYEFHNKDTGQKLKIKPRKLGPGEKNRLDDEWHRKPYRDEIADLDKIVLCEFRDYGDGHWTGLPNDHEFVWEIRAVSSKSFVIQLTNGAELCVMNNKPITVRGKSFEDALKEIFPTQKIDVYYPIHTTRKKVVR